MRKLERTCVSCGRPISGAWIDGRAAFGQYGPLHIRCAAELERAEQAERAERAERAAGRGRGKGAV